MPVMTPAHSPVAAGPDVAAALPAVSAALWVWDTMSLQIGEIAVVTDGHRLSRLVALAATWYGAEPALLVTGNPASTPPGVTAVSDVTGSDETRAMAARLARRPGVVAVELSGRAEAVDLLLESIPMWTRVMFAGPRREAFTIDYYVNVHRKGLTLVSGVIEGDGNHAAVAEGHPRLERARRLLSRPGRLQACLDALR